MLNGTASDRGSDEEEAGVGGGGEGGGDGGGVKKETDAKRLRLITDFVKEEGDVEGGGGDAVAGVATGTGGGEGGKTDEEDDDALVSVYPCSAALPASKQNNWELGVRIGKHFRRWK